MTFKLQPPVSIHDSILYQSCAYDNAEELQNTDRVGFIHIDDKFTVQASIYDEDAWKNIRMTQDIFYMCLPISKWHSDYDASTRILAMSYMFEEHDGISEVPLYTWWYGSRNNALLCAIL